MPKKPIDHYQHPDKRANIPTQELSGLAEEAETHPETTLYPRDTSLDPQLVWKGKDEQDANALGVHAVPIYAQEHIQPEAIIQMLRKMAIEENSQTEPLFEGFSALELEERVEFYQHEQNWNNRLILGDSLLVMNSLAEKEALKSQVQTIYFDPPYGIKFGSNWQVSTRKPNVGETKQEDVTLQPEQIRAFRDTWELGIHSYLAYLRDRLTVARELLTDSGSLFLQISDENVHLVRALLDEVFGSDNFVTTIAWTRGNMTSSAGLASVFDYLLWYAKDKEQMKYRQLYIEWDERAPDPLLKSYARVELPDGTRRRMTNPERKNPALLPEGSRRFADLAILSQTRGSATHEYEFEGRPYTPPRSSGWKASSDGLKRLTKQGRLMSTGTSLRYIRYASDFPGRRITSLWTDTAGGRFDRAYVVETNSKVIQRCILMTSDPGDLVLDPTCGSGTTAYVAEQWGRRWITIDTSRVALALARTRLMSAVYPYYRLEDATDIKQGFVYKTAPHISLSDMANNLEIDDIHAEYAPKLNEIRELLNASLHKGGSAWEEWEVPQETDPSWSAETQRLHTRWFSLKRERQAEMDASTARRATSEILYDGPYSDRSRTRVAGPFTVESLSPHRVQKPLGETAELNTPVGEPSQSRLTPSPDSSQDFHTHIVAHLKTAGVQNRVKAQRLTFDELAPFPGEYLQAEGAYTDENGASQSVAISIGPRYETVGRQWMSGAVKEAVRRIPKFELLIVLGFTFEGYTADERTRIGSLPILPVKMSPELMIDELKNTGAGNLFMNFGEPDIEIHRQPDNTLVVKLLGVDVFDARQGLVRSNDPGEIACWFIDTDYDEEAFFVRHAYFTGADEPYKKLKQALRAEIDASAWESLYRTESLPFARPEGGKIAVKVINHYGDEVLKVYEV